MENRRLWTFPTESGFGTLADFDPAKNPLLKKVGKIGDKEDATANDAFRVVHDIYGHFSPGNPFFRHKGEERAWYNHSRMYSPEALPAMSSETRGQNSWLNFGPHGARNRTAGSDETIFADQKTGLMPPEMYLPSPVKSRRVGDAVYASPEDHVWEQFASPGDANRVVEGYLLRGRGAGIDPSLDDGRGAVVRRWPMQSPRGHGDPPPGWTYSGKAKGGFMDKQTARAKLKGYLEGGSVELPAGEKRKRAKHAEQARAEALQRLRESDEGLDNLPRGRVAIGPASEPTMRQRLANMIRGEGTESSTRGDIARALVGTRGMDPDAGFSAVDQVPFLGYALDLDDDVRFRGGRAWDSEDEMQEAILNSGAGPGMGNRGLQGVRRFEGGGRGAAGKLLKGALKTIERKIKEASPTVISRDAREEPKFPHLAEEYPKTGPHGWDSDKTGKTWPAKQHTEEEAALLKERDRIQKDMFKNGFEPYFDPKRRADVDPANYPREGTTLTELVGSQPKSQAKHEAIAMSKGALERLEDAYDVGRGFDFDRWYFMKQLEDKFIEELGQKAGRKAFADRFAGSMAATTGGADPVGNLLASGYGNVLHGRGLPTPGNAYDMPSPVGGRFISGNMEQHRRIFNDNEGVIDLNNPKRHNFKFNFLGHRDLGTIDEQMMGLILDKKGGIPPKEFYGIYERPIHELADKRGIDPREFQEVAWGGGRLMGGNNMSKAERFVSRPMIQVTNEAIERIHRLTGMDRDEIVKRGLINGEIPLYSEGGPAGALSSSTLTKPLPGTQA